MSEIEKLFSGKIYPEENIMPSGEEYDEERKASLRALEALQETLNREQLDLLDSYIDHSGIVQGMYAFEFYREGMLQGAKLLMELLGKEV